MEKKLRKRWKKKLSDKITFDYHYIENIQYHLLDILDDLEIAEPPDFTDIEPCEDIKPTELGALFSISIPCSLKTSSSRGPNSGS